MVGRLQNFNSDKFWKKQQKLRNYRSMLREENALINDENTNEFHIEVNVAQTLFETAKAL